MYSCSQDQLYLNTSVLPGGNPCLTTSDGPQKLQPCVFPFQVAGEVYNECIRISSDQSVCATKVDENGVYVVEEGCQSEDCANYGFCGPNCPVAEQGKEINPTAANG